MGTMIRTGLHAGHQGCCCLHRFKGERPAPHASTAACVNMGCLACCLPCPATTVPCWRVNHQTALQSTQRLFGICLAWCAVSPALVDTAACMQCACFEAQECWAAAFDATSCVCTYVCVCVLDLFSLPFTLEMAPASCRQTAQATPRCASYQQRLCLLCARTPMTVPPSCICRPTHSLESQLGAAV